MTSDKAMDLTSDTNLLKLFREPSTREQAFKQLITCYQRQIYSHIRRIVITHEDTDDLVQNTFINVWKNLDNFREDAKLSTWIYRIATNEALLFLRRKRQRSFIALASVEHSLEASLEDDAYFSADQITMKLQKAILALPEKQRLVFNMRYYDELSYDEISTILGTSIGALKASYHIAVKKIEKILTAD